MDRMERRESIGTMFKRQLRNSRHLQSAGLEEQISPMQWWRQRWEPCLPSVMLSPVSAEEFDLPASTQGSSLALSPGDEVALNALFPNTIGQKFCRLVPCKTKTNWQSHPPLRIGVVLSGGQAPGGHNVISGVYDYVKKCNANSQLIGFLGGPHGIFTHNYVEITDQMMNEYRNMGGFDMIRSGRHKIETMEQKEKSTEVCKKLDLHGLVVIGGDDSNTNAAILAEYFKSQACSTLVIGCPKTIDGDLKNEFVEASFGFDTAVKTYSEFIGNLCMDVATSGKYYHFVRLMGRSASNIALECAIQTRPNLTLIGEEVKEKNRSLKDIVDEIVDMIVRRSEAGRDYGVILLPEGLIEFVPEIGVLIQEINQIVATGEFDLTKLTEHSREVFQSLPASIRGQLLLDRDPHGNVQVAMIATEKLLMLMVEEELYTKKGFQKGSFNPQAHYFGYEGRCGMPSNFDANYCYSLGHVAAALIDNGCTGCMAIVSNLWKDPEDWSPQGVPLTKMMNIERRKGKDVPVIKKYLVDMQGPLFNMFVKAREDWKWRDLYRCPGPIQYEGPLAEISNSVVKAPELSELLPAKPKNYEELKERHHFVMSEGQMSVLQKERLVVPCAVNPILASGCPLRLTPLKSALSGTSDVERAAIHDFPLQSAKHHHVVYEVEELNRSSTTSHTAPSSSLPNCTGTANSVSGTAGGIVGGAVLGSLTGHATVQKPRLGVVLTGQQAPGVSNVVWGLYERVALLGGKLFGFHGAAALLKGECIEIEEDDLKFTKNQGGFCFLGRTSESEGKIASPEGVACIRSVCQKLNLSGLVMIGGRWTLTDCAILAEDFERHKIPTSVVGVPASQNNNIDGRFVECTIGFDTASKCYSQLIGNLLTDAASATKYWYFIRLMGRDKSHVVMETALQSHPNVTLISESYAAGDKTLEDVVGDIADVICDRSEQSKNFGALLIPEGLIMELPQMKQLEKEVNKVLQRVDLQSDSDIATVTRELVELDRSSQKYTSLMAPWAVAFLSSLPEFIRKQFIQPRHVGRFQISQISSEELLSRMVAAELARRKKEGAYNGSFNPVCFYLGYQARSSLPSKFDCSLGLSNGYLASICVENRLSGYATSMRGLCGQAHTWRPFLFPVSGLLRITHTDEMYAMKKIPMVPSDMVKLEGKPYKKLLSASMLWERHDRFCNPGPIQFWGNASFFYSRYLFELQHEYMRNLGDVNRQLHSLQQMCTFGIEESAIGTISVTLEMLRKILSVNCKLSDGDQQHLVNHDPQGSMLKMMMMHCDDDYTSQMTGGGGL